MINRLPKSIAMLLLALAVTLPATQAAAEMSLGEAINQAGRQRMLTQRMVKAYCQVLLGVDAEEPRKQLEKAVALFQTQLDNLNAFATTPEVRMALAEVETLWRPFQPVASGNIDAAGLTRLVELNEQLLQAAHQVVLRLEELSETPAGRLTNISGRQRMLSQRIAKFYMLMAYGIRNETVVAGLNKAAEQFRDALIELENSPVNTFGIKQNLATVHGDWGVLEANIANIQEGKYSVYTVATYSERVLETMNRVTGLYAELPTQ